VQALDAWWRACNDLSFVDAHVSRLVRATGWVLGDWATR
jgi:hypothetical protein